MSLVVRWSKSSLGIILLLCLMGLSSCNKKEPVYEVCNCQGSKLENIKNEGGVLASSADGLKIITVNHGYLTTCFDFPSDFQTEGTLVQFSGRLISTCKKLHSGYAVWSTYLDLGTISKVDTLYVHAVPTIQIVKTEDFGLQPGFGYILNDTLKHFKIQQFEIPGVGGMDPFKSYNDALKISFLMAYKLENTNDFPTIYLGDLAFLNIQGTH